MRKCSDGTVGPAGQEQEQREGDEVTRFTFGQHKGKVLEDIPTDYLTWALTKATACIFRSSTARSSWT